MQGLKSIGRERLSGIVIILSLFLIIMTLLSVNWLDVKVVNLELVDRGLYTVVTEKGNINIQSDDILRIERTYTQAPITGVPIELDKIYTNKGFIYLSSADSFAQVGRELMNSVDFYGLPIWERPNTDWQSVRPYSYSIGTPSKQIPFLFFFLSLQYAALSLGGVALSILIFPLRFGEEDRQSNLTHSQQEQDFLNEEPLRQVAK
jgi:hypothetical protein